MWVPGPIIGFDIARVAPETGGDTCTDKIVYLYAPRGLTTSPSLAHCSVAHVWSATRSLHVQIGADRVSSLTKQNIRPVTRNDALPRGAARGGALWPSGHAPAAHLHAAAPWVACSRIPHARRGAACLHDPHTEPLLLLPTLASPPPRPPASASDHRDQCLRSDRRACSPCPSQTPSTRSCQDPRQWRRRGSHRATCPVASPACSQS